MKEYFNNNINIDVEFYIGEKEVGNINTDVDIELEMWTDPGDYYRPPEYEIDIIDENKVIREITNNLKFSDGVKNQKLFKQIIEYIIWDLFSELEINSPEDTLSISEEISIDYYLETGKF